MTPDLEAKVRKAIKQLWYIVGQHVDADKWVITLYRNGKVTQQAISNE